MADCDCSGCDFGACDCSSCDCGDCSGCDCGDCDCGGCHCGSNDCCTPCPCCCDCCSNLNVYWCPLFCFEYTAPPPTTINRQVGENKREVNGEASPIMNQPTAQTVLFRDQSDATIMGLASQQPVIAPDINSALPPSYDEATKNAK